ncbi:MAG: DegV family protein [Lachnospiraceae bacterium]|nr:DegV family protein [Lachnospiraceae bacterium]
MAKPTIITVDSTADLSPELRERYGIRVIPLTITLGERTFPDDGAFTSHDLFENYRKDGQLPHTAAPGVQEFIDFFTEILKEGAEIVHLDISAQLSNTYNVARMAAQSLEGVYTVDSMMLSTGVALLAIEAAECRDKGMGAAEIAAHLNDLRHKVSTSFVLDTLEFMWKGGRCSGVTLLGANLLKLKPALRMNNGKLEVYKKYRGRIENVYRQYFTDELKDRKVRPAHVFITESGEVDPAVILELTDLVKQLCGAREVHHTVAGCTVASHCGPKTLGVLFIEE